MDITDSDIDRFLGLDYITPHENPLKNPTPIQFLKLLPGVQILFQFEWHKLIIKGKKLEVEKLEELFKTILEDLGIGAKTNVGYGQLINVKNH